MKVILINGSPRKEGCTNVALSEMASELEKLGIVTEREWLGIQPMADCIACGKCKTSGECIFDDAVNRIGRKLDGFQGIVVGSPVYYGGINGRTCSFLERLCYTFGPKMPGMAAAGVVSCRRGGATAAYERFQMYFGMMNMFTIGSQYWNQIHGNTPEEAKQDLEGLQTMRTLAQNMAWFLKNREAGEKAGIAYPSCETVIKTNFIR